MSIELRGRGGKGLNLDEQTEAALKDVLSEDKYGVDSEPIL